MEIDVGEQRRNDSSLGSASLAGPIRSIFLNTRLEKTLDVAQYTLVCYAVSQKIHQLILVNIVEKTFYVSLNNIINPTTFDGSA